MKRLVVTYGSERLDAKGQRRKARTALKRGVEPQPLYRTGRFWND